MLIFLIVFELYPSYILKTDESLLIKSNNVEQEITESSSHLCIIILRRRYSSMMDQKIYFVYQFQIIKSIRKFFPILNRSIFSVHKTSQEIYRMKRCRTQQIITLFIGRFRKIMDGTKPIIRYLGILGIKFSTLH